MTQDEIRRALRRLARWTDSPTVRRRARRLLWKLAREDRRWAVELAGDPFDEFNLGSPAAARRARGAARSDEKNDCVGHRTERNESGGSSGVEAYRRRGAEAQGPQGARGHGRKPGAAEASGAWQKKRLDGKKNSQNSDGRVARPERNLLKARG